MYGFVDQPEHGEDTTQNRAGRGQEFVADMSHLVVPNQHGDGEQAKASEKKKTDSATTTTTTTTTTKCDFVDANNFRQ